jgi:hypothetical protein
MFSLLNSYYATILNGLNDQSIARPFTSEGWDG